MGNNYVKQLGIKPEGRIGTKEFNLIWERYAEKDNTMKKKNAIKFLKDFAVAVGVKSDDALFDKLLHDAGIASSESYLTKDAFITLFFANAESRGHSALTRSVLAYKQRVHTNPKIPSSIPEGTSTSSSSQSIKKPQELPPASPSPGIPSPKSSTNLVNSHPPNDEKIEELFRVYASSEDDTVIDPNGLIMLLNDLEIQPNDVALLVIAYHMQAATMGVFTKVEFVNGLTKMKIRTLEALKEAIPKLRNQINSALMFPEIYKFAFNFYKENPNHKSIGLDVADMVLELVAPDKPHIPKFRKFLLKQKEYKSVNMDQWINILAFSQTVDEDLTDYDAESASWPFIIDLFVEWVKEGHTGDSEEEKKEEVKKKGEYDFDF